MDRKTRDTVVEAKEQGKRTVRLVAAAEEQAQQTRQLAEASQEQARLTCQQLAAASRRQAEVSAATLAHLRREIEFPQRPRLVVREQLMDHSAPRRAAARDVVSRGAVPGLKTWDAEHSPDWADAVRRLASWLSPEAEQAVPKASRTSASAAREASTGD